MILLIIKLGLMANLVWICWQDMRSRTVSVFSLASYGVLISGLNYELFNTIIYIDQLMNLAIITIVGLLLLVYIRIRFGDVRRWESGIGLGDLMFIGITALGLCFYSYLIWFNISMVFALLVHLLLRKFKFYGDQNAVPLAGLQAITLIPIFWFELTCQ